jgi:hypothetical protein
MRRSIPTSVYVTGGHVQDVNRPDKIVPEEYEIRREWRI